MAFVNAYLTEEEKNRIAKAQLRDPRYEISKKYLKPSKWTVDRDRNIALIYCGELDREEYYKKIFVLVCEEFDNDHMLSISLITNYYERKEVEQLRELYQVDLVKKWKLVDMKIPDVLKSKDSQDVYNNVILEALSVYGVNGNPDITLSTKAFLEIEGDIK